MLSYIEIKSKIKKWWDDGSFLKASISGTPYFKRDVPKIGLDDIKNIHKNIDSVFKSQDELVKNSKEVKGYGFSIEWQEKNYKIIGSNKFIKRITVDTEEDFLKLIHKEKEFTIFKENVNFILGEFPELKEWMLQNPLLIVDNATKWEELIKVLKYFKGDHILDEYYIRELPVNVHTKFIEQNKTIISGLLNTLIPDKVNTSEKDFHSRYYLKNKEKLIRIRLLCPELASKYPYKDFSIPLSDFNRKEIPSHAIFITENEMNFLTLPPKKNAIAIWSGGGFQISYLSNVEWMKEKNIYYWGDIDAAGLAILSQLRSYYPNSISLLMDKSTFDKYYQDGKSDKKIPANNLKGLEEKELELFYYLKQGNLRLEQEKIPQKEINDIMSNI
jgi:hypothetical protein